MSVIGRIHSFESCGTVDGPGIRFITFFQGCLMRCLYCHNRDTWDTHGGKEITVEELMKEVVTYRHFMNASGGGVTASGGEVLDASYKVPSFSSSIKMPIFALEFIILLYLSG